VIEQITVACPDQSTVAYFYFDFRNKRQRLDIMLRSIIWQLSGRSPSPYSALHRLYKTLGNGTIQPQHVHLQGVLEDLLSELNRTYIIIDGLDECHQTDWRSLVQFIHNLCHPTENALHLLFTSQPLREFQKAFTDVTFIKLGSVVSTTDIRSFVGSEVRGIGNWASEDKYVNHVTEQIVQKSNGMLVFSLYCNLFPSSLAYPGFAWLHVSSLHWVIVIGKTTGRSPSQCFQLISLGFMAIS
jgi:hypothetical protein